MGRHGVTLEEVAGAIQKLHAEGKHPTIEAIRQTIGSGSKSTITRHLRTLKHEALPAVPSSPPFAQHSAAAHTTIPPEFLNLVTSLWEKMQSGGTIDATAVAKTHSDESIQKKYNDLQQAHDLVTRQLQMRMRAFTQLEEKFSQQQQLIKALEQEIKQKNIYNQELARRVKVLASDLQQAKISLQHLQQQIGTLENSRRQLVQEKQRLEERSRQLQQGK